MRFHSRLLLFIVAYSIIAQPAHGQSEALKASMQAFVDSGELPGLVTFVGNQDGVIDVEVLGMADLENKVPMKRDTIFRIASMTKPITSLAIMQLVEEGKVLARKPWPT